MIIAIDGPAASGKSSIAKLLAKKLNFVHFSTGLMYRALTAFIVHNNLLNALPKSIIEIIDDLKITISGDHFDIIKINNINFYKSYFDAEINKYVSAVSAIKEVRIKMVELQRSLSKNNIVCEGRDIGTVVFPEAEKKFFLNATLDCRVDRRYNELLEIDSSITKKKLKILLNERDEFDRNRNISPLKVASDAILVDTTNLGIEEVIDILYKNINGDLNII